MRAWKSTASMTNVRPRCKYTAPGCTRKKASRSSIVSNNTVVFGTDDDENNDEDDDEDDSEVANEDGASASTR